ncbi:TPA: hypothetical protein SMP34_003844 [Proteus mirabilis]|nr:hypothetical protein [Proteus mirabilis]
MTVHHDQDKCPVLQSILVLRDSINAIDCACCLIPEDITNDLPVVIMLKRLSERLEADLKDLLSAYYLVLK